MATTEQERRKTHDHHTAGARGADGSRPDGRAPDASGRASEQSGDAGSGASGQGTGRGRQDSPQQDLRNAPSHPNADDPAARKQHVLTQHTASLVASIADAVVIKDVGLFFLCHPDGEVPMGKNHGYGLYYHDCRYLNGYTLEISGTKPSELAATASSGYRAAIEATNVEIREPSGHTIRKQDLGIRWDRLVDGTRLTLTDTIRFQNFGSDDVHFTAKLSFSSAFEDIFTIRGLLHEQHGKLHDPRWEHGRLLLEYEGGDDIDRRVEIGFSEEPRSRDGASATFEFHLATAKDARLTVEVAVWETPKGHRHPAWHQADPAKASKRMADAQKAWGERQPDIDSALVLDEVLGRAFTDLHVLRSKNHDQDFLAAGVPWFVALFGRDSIIAALQLLAYDPSLAEHTLRVLASRQGEREDHWRDEEPGKILHELRVGEYAHLHEIPHTPYYGTVDATPLFLILVARHAAWTGSLDVFRELESNVERALEWIDKYGDKDRDGYVEYRSNVTRGLVNQGWKDSGDAIVNRDGSLATPPIALVEVQGYVYMAKTELAKLYRRAGNGDKADQLEREAEDLKERFDRDFWVDDIGFYALARQKDGKPCAVVSSNPGQALWTGIVKEERAQQVVERLMADDMFNGWGVRTLSSKERRYNPIGYHLGTVWPHDNGIIAAGFRRYGFDDEAGDVFSSLVHAALSFEEYRLPECFSGFARQDYGIPVRYPVACHPQAWAAGAIPYLLHTALGLVPEGFDHRLRIVRPMLPDFAHELTIRRLRVADASIDLRFERTGTGVAVEVLGIDGDLDVVVEPPLPARPQTDRQRSHVHHGPGHHAEPSRQHPPAHGHAASGAPAAQRPAGGHAPSTGNGQGGRQGDGSATKGHNARAASKADARAAGAGDGKAAGRAAGGGSRAGSGGSRGEPAHARSGGGPEGSHGNQANRSGGAKGKRP